MRRRSRRRLSDSQIELSRFPPFFSLNLAILSKFRQGINFRKEVARNSKIQMLQHLRALTEEDHGRDHSSHARIGNEFRGIRRVEGTRQLPGRSVAFLFFADLESNRQSSFTYSPFVFYLLFTNCIYVCAIPTLSFIKNISILNQADS